MRANSENNIKVYFEPYGCSMNIGETRKMAHFVKQLSGFEIVEDIKLADIFVLVTCTVIQTTENRMIKRLKQFSTFKKPTIVAGCMTAVQPDLIQQVYPGVTMIFPYGLKNICNAVSELSKLSIVSREGNFSGIDPPKIKCEVLPNLKKHADTVIPIAQGCLGKCNYCITKLARGRLKSYPVDYILSEVRNAVRDGFKEIRLSAQDTCAYGEDIGSSLPKLISRITKLSGDFKIRIGMMNPDTLLPRLDDLIESYKNRHVFKFLHLPVQSGDNEILSKMNRRYKVVDFKYIIKKFRKIHPELTFSTDVIAGFPGETEEQFKNTLQLIEEVRPNIVNIKAFSPRPKTPAYLMSGKITNRIVKNRTRALTRLCSNISKDLNAKLIGRKMNVMITEIGKPGSVIGRTNNYKGVVLQTKIIVGKTITAKIVGATKGYLIGEVI